jgi:hypothetical protein
VDSQAREDLYIGVYHKEEHFKRKMLQKDRFLIKEWTQWLEESCDVFHFFALFLF